MIPTYVIGIGVVLVLIVVIQVSIFVSRYTRVGPNQVLIVSGRKVRRPDGTCVGFRIVKGGGTFVLPILEKADVLTLEVLTVGMSKTKVRTAQGGMAEVDCAAQVRIQGDDDSITAAAKHFAGKGAVYIKSVVWPLLERHLRATLGDSSLEAMRGNLDTLANKVQSAAAAELGEMGLGFVSFVIRDVRAA